MRRIVVTHRHLRGRQTAELPSPSMVRLRVSILGLYQPHTGKVTVPGTGTRQPSSCGKGPKAVGESVMTLPGKPQGDATWLECKGLDLSLWWQSRCSSLSTGKPCTWRSCDPFPRNDATRQGWGAEVEEIFDNLGVVEVQFLSP